MSVLPTTGKVKKENSLGGGPDIPWGLELPDCGVKPAVKPIVGTNKRDYWAYKSPGSKKLNLIDTGRRLNAELDWYIARDWLNSFVSFIM